MFFQSVFMLELVINTRCSLHRISPVC